MRMAISMPPVQSPPKPRLRNAGKRTTNLSLGADVLDAARGLQINLCQVCDSYLREVIQREQERLWRHEHADFIAAYNATIEVEGLPLEEGRAF